MTHVDEIDGRDEVQQFPGATAGRSPPPCCCAPTNEPGAVPSSEASKIQRRRHSDAELTHGVSASCRYCFSRSSSSVCRAGASMSTIHLAHSRVMFVIRQQATVARVPPRVAADRAPVHHRRASGSSNRLDGAAAEGAEAIAIKRRDLY
jgi:hypothetical protein